MSALLAPPPARARIKGERSAPQYASGLGKAQRWAAGVEAGSFTVHRAGACVARPAKLAPPPPACPGLRSAASGRARRAGPGEPPPPAGLAVRHRPAGCRPIASAAVHFIRGPVGLGRGALSGPIVRSPVREFAFLSWPPGRTLRMRFGFRTLHPGERPLSRDAPSVHNLNH